MLCPLFCSLAISYALPTNAPQAHQIDEEAHAKCVLEDGQGGIELDADVSDLFPELNRLLRKCLSPKPDNRWRVGRLKSSLEAVAERAASYYDDIAELGCDKRALETSSLRRDRNLILEVMDTVSSVGHDKMWKPAEAGSELDAKAWTADWNVATAGKRGSHGYFWKGEMTFPRPPQLCVDALRARDNQGLSVSSSLAAERRWSDAVAAGDKRSKVDDEDSDSDSDSDSEASSKSFARQYSRFHADVFCSV